MGQAPRRDHEASPQSGLGLGCELHPSSKKRHGLGVQAQARRIRAYAYPPYYLFWEFPRSCLPRVERRGAALGSAIQGPGKRGALSLVLIVQTVAEEVHRVHFEPRNGPGLRWSWSNALLQGPAVG